MASERVEVVQLHCERCDHKWIPREPGRKPGTCPNPLCRSPYWDKPRRRQAVTP